MTPHENEAKKNAYHSDTHRPCGLSGHTCDILLDAKKRTF